MTKILVIDDERPILEVLDISLSSEGYDVITAENSAEGLKIFEEQGPQALILTDIRMPGMDGIEVLRRIKEAGPETEVIVITGQGDMDLAIQSLKLDASDFVTKPVGDEVISVALRRAQERLDTRRLLKEYTNNLELMVKDATEELRKAHNFQKNRKRNHAQRMWP